MEKENDKRVWKKKCLDYQQCKKAILHLKEGISTTEDVWNKYVKHIEDLITSGKIKDQAAITIQNRVMSLKNIGKISKKFGSFSFLNRTLTFMILLILIPINNIMSINFYQDRCRSKNSIVLLKN